MPHAPLQACAVALLAALPAAAFGLDGQRADVQDFMRQMQEQHGFSAAQLEPLFAQVESRPSILAAISRPAEKSRPWFEYRAIFLTDRRIERGRATAQQQSESLGKAAAGGVPADVIVAITGVETFYGEVTGKHRVIDALATLAFDYPPRSEFFRRELEQFLLMSREETLDPLGPNGSYAGAMGIPQFMPSSFRAYAVDGDGDGRRDLWGSWSDVFASVANYLGQHGWRAGEPVMVTADVAGADLAGLRLDTIELTETVGSLRGRGVRFEVALPDTAPAALIELTGAAGPEYRVGFTNFYAITRYNRSRMYASAVNDLAQAIAGAAPPAVLPAVPPAPPAFSSVSTAE
jgi:membrane-bound lytic murein transglycosylase B